MRNDLTNSCDRILYKVGGDKTTQPKKRYDTDEQAIIACKKINSRDHQIHKVTPYKCPTCKCYHIGKTKKVLSSSDKKKYKDDLKYL